MESNADVDEAVEMEDTPTDEPQAENTQDAPQEEAPTVKRMVKVPLDDEMIKAIVAELAELWEQKGKVEDGKAAAAKRANESIKGLEGQITSLFTKYNAGETSVEVECVIDYDWDNRKKSFVRKDTGEVIDEDAISEAEMQRQFPGMEGGEVDGESDGEEEPPPGEASHDCYNMVCSSCDGKVCQSDQTEPKDCQSVVSTRPENVKACANDKCDESSGDECQDESKDVACINQCPYYQAPEKEG